MTCFGERFADDAAERFGDERRAVPADELRLVAHAISDMATKVWEHSEDSDDPAAIAALLLDLRDAKQALAEAFSRVETAYVHCAGDKKMEHEGVGVVEIRKQVKRSNWRSDDLWDDLFDAVGADIEVFRKCIRPSWRLGPLRELGVDPSDYCVEEPDGWAVVLPTRDLDERF